LLKWRRGRWTVVPREDPLRVGTRELPTTTDSDLQRRDGRMNGGAKMRGDGQRTDEETKSGGVMRRGAEWPICAVGRRKPPQ
jgi:hypothetical protein